MPVSFDFEDVVFEFPVKDSLEKIIKKLAADNAVSPGNISVIFCSDEYLLELNQQYLSHDFYTDIITFDYSEKDSVAGDLFISYDRVKENSEVFGNTVLNELSRVVIHGVLHLLGYNDKTDSEKHTMTCKEDEYLSLME